MSKITLPPLPLPDVKAGEYAGPPGEGASENYWSAEQMQERDRQVVEHVIRACAQAAKQCKSGLGAEAAILALLPVKEPKE